MTNVWGCTRATLLPIAYCLIPKKRRPSAMSNSGSTIYDIAAEAGVSITTVSRVLRGSGSVSA